MPLLAMMYPRGKKIKDEYSEEYIAHAARVGAELGADIVKTNYTGDPDGFARVVERAVRARGHCRRAKVDSEMDLLRMVQGAISAGARGVAIGQNVFNA